MCRLQQGQLQRQPRCERKAQPLVAVHQISQHLQGLITSEQGLLAAHILQKLLSHKFQQLLQKQAHIPALGG